MAPPARSRGKSPAKLQVDGGDWYDLEVKQFGNSKVQVETAKKKLENISDWNYLPPMGHSSDIVKYKNEEGDSVIAIIALGGQDWKDPTRGSQISADIFIKQLLVTNEEVAGLGPFIQIKAIKPTSTKQTASMAEGSGSMIRPLKNASLNVTNSTVNGSFVAILAFGEFLEAGGSSNLTSNYIFKVSGNAETSSIEDVTLYLSTKPEDNPMYGGVLPDSPLLVGHKPTGRRGQTGTVIGNSYILYVGGVQHTNQLLRKSRIPDPFLILNSEKMEVVKLNHNFDFHRAHHCTEFVKSLNIIIVCGGMLVPSEEGSKVTDWFRIDTFSLFKLDESLTEIYFTETVTVELGIEPPLEMQGVASSVFGTEVVLAGGFVKPMHIPKVGEAPKMSSRLISVDIKTKTAKVLDDDEASKTAQATLQVIDSKAVLLLGGSMEALKIFTSKPMSEEQPCVFADKCRVYQKIVKSEIEKLEISCENHENIFSHILCDPQLRSSIPSIKRMLKNGQPIPYSNCPVCKGTVGKKKKT